MNARTRNEPMPAERKIYTEQDMINANRVAVLESRVQAIGENYITGPVLTGAIAESEHRTTEKINEVGKQVNRATWIITGVMLTLGAAAWLDKYFSIFTIGS